MGLDRDKCIHNMKGCDCLGAAVVLPEGRSWVSDIPVLGKGQLVTCGLQQDVLIGVTFRVRYLTTSTVFTCLVLFLQDQLMFTVTLLSLLYLTGKYGIMACPFHLLLSFTQGECGTKCQLSHPLGIYG